MTTSEGESRLTDPARVRLAWPGDRPGPDRAGEPSPEPDPVDPTSFGDDETEALRPEVEGNRSLAPIDDGGLGAPGLRRAIVDAYDRLADRVLQRMRSLHEDVDADLAELRSEVTTLRQAVDDLGDRVQLRSLRAAVDELRSDVVGMRRVLLEWPELERVSGDITSLRADMTDVVASISSLVEDEVLTRDGGEGGERATTLIGPLAEEISQLRDDVAELNRTVTDMATQRDRASSTLAAALAPVLEELAEIRTEVAALREAAPAEAPQAGGDSEAVAAELAALRDELVSLRRRISLRAGS